MEASKKKTELERYSAFVGKTANRDKVLKTIGYVCKLFIAFDKSWEPRLKALGSKCSEARRMFWLGRSVAEFHTLQGLLAKGEGTLVWAIQVAARFGFVVRYLFENYIILAKQGFFKPANLPEVVRMCSKFWLLAVGGTFLANTIQLIKKQNQLSALCAKVDAAACHETRTRAAKLEAERDKLAFTVVSTIGDCTNACTGSNFIQTVAGITPSPKFISTFGTIGGFMQVYSNYA